MSDDLRHPVLADGTRSLAVPPVLTLDRRRVLQLDSCDGAFLVTAGAVDVFAQLQNGAQAKSRVHLFRVERGGALLGLLKQGSTQGRLPNIFATGSQGSEVLPLERGDLIEKRYLLSQWLSQMSAAISRLGIRQLQTDAHFGGPEEVSVFATPLVSVNEENSWESVDRFHALIIPQLKQALERTIQIEASRLRWRAEAASAKAQQALTELAGVVDSRLEPARKHTTADPLFNACRIGGEAMGIVMVRPPQPVARGNDFQALMAICRASRMRLRRTLLRGEWWRHCSDPLIAWYGEERRPVTILPISSDQCALVDPESGRRLPVDEMLAEQISRDAALLYLPTGAGPLSTVRLLWCAIARRKADANRILLTMMMSALVGLAAPLVTAGLIDDAIPHSDMGELAFSIAALVLAALGVFAFQAILGVATLRLSSAMDCTMQAAIVDRLLRLPVTFFKQYTVGELSYRVLGIERIRQVLTEASIGGMLGAVFLLAGTAMMFVLDAHLAFMAVVLIITYGLLIIVTSLVRLHYERQNLELQSKTSGLVLQFLTGIAKLRAAAATNRALALWARVFATQKRSSIASQRVANVLMAFEAGFPALATMVLFALGNTDQAGAPGTSAMDAGRFIAFYVVFMQSVVAIVSFSTALREVLITGLFFERLQPVLRAAIDVPVSAEEPGQLSGAIALHQVTFRYDDQSPPVLDRLSMQIRAGEYVALVGPSGSGKSTIFRLLLGFERAQGGVIMFDGRPIDRLNIESVRRQIGVVLQDGKLITGSIYENICGAIQAPMEDAWEAARQAGISEDIEAMPMGMHTMISEGMSTLSGGQCQRVMIARALIHRPRILLFDEATSALDNRNQATVSAAARKLNVTRIVIAHRLSTVRNADRILVLVNGAIAQSGTYDELSSKSGMFAELTRRQLA